MPDAPWKKTEPRVSAGFIAPVTLPVIVPATFRFPANVEVPVTFRAPLSVEVPETVKSVMLAAAAVKRPEDKLVAEK